MKTLINFFALVVVLASTLPSCTTDLGPDLDNKEETTLPSSSVGTYSGSLTYTSSTGDVIANVDGEAELKKSGSTYSISFSDGVPGLSNITFAKDGTDWISVSAGSSVSGITVDDEDLDLGVNINGNVWAFSGEK